MPAVNLSNRLNPNNIHYDRELAARYKRMSKPEKEALWARDREMQKQKVHIRPPGLLICTVSSVNNWLCIQSSFELCVDTGVRLCLDALKADRQAACRGAAMTSK
jgi:hypothetical protein